MRRLTAIGIAVLAAACAMNAWAQEAAGPQVVIVATQGPRSHTINTRDIEAVLGHGIVAPIDTGLRPEGVTAFRIDDPNRLSTFEGDIRGTDFRLVTDLGAVIGPAQERALAREVRARISDLREQLGENNVDSSFVFPPSLLTEAARPQIFGRAPLQITLGGEAHAITRIERAGDQYRIQLDEGVGEARLREAPLDPSDPQSPLVLHGDVVLGADMYRVVPMDGRGAAVALRLPGAMTARDHREDMVPAAGAGLVRQCVAKPDQVITLGIAISQEAAPRYGLAPGARLGAPPSAISGVLTDLNKILHDQYSLNVRFEPVMLIDHPAAWTRRDTPDDYYYALKAEIKRNVPGEFFDLLSGWDKTHADMILLLVDTPSEKYCGLSTLYAQGNDAYGVVNDICADAPRSSMIHELGHMLGACHEPRSYGSSACGPSEPGVARNRYAWRAKDGAAGDVMATWPDPPTLPFVRMLQFSEVGKNGADGDATMDFAKALRDRADYVSTFAQCRG